MNINFESIKSNTMMEHDFKHPLVTGSAPAWASEWGEDNYGIWAGFVYKEVRQRMRWIPPGRFQMGSHENESGRDDDEKQHWVTLTDGFWLFDTPVTQALWQAVMGENPSRFQSPQRPVEQVSWDDGKKFMQKLNTLIPGLELGYPTEAQWEYACRAGTTTATYVGDLEIKGENNAPILDDIAWYGGNSGIDFELDDGHDSSDWPEKQYKHERAGTHPVGLKKPNAWGLYDMLGNVDEWCEDYWDSEYDTEEQVNPTGPSEGAYRVSRGGSWSDYARSVRAAYRSNWGPDDRHNDLGFRPARGHA